VRRSTRTAVVVGGAFGAFLGLGAVAMSAARVLHSGVDAGPTFVVGQAGKYLFVVVAGALGGAVLGLVGYVVGRETDPETPRFGAGAMAVVATGIGAVAAFATFRASAGLTADIVNGVVTLTVFRAIVIGLITGAVTGAMSAGMVERVSRPAAFGFAGDAWPSSPRAFVRDSIAAVGLPILGLVIGVSAVYLFSRVLLHADDHVAVTLFGGVAALILFGAAAVAATSGRRSHRSE
jgi:hypothetical protein